MGGGGGAVVPAAPSTVVVGDDQACALDAAGVVFCWGERRWLPTDDGEAFLLTPSAISLPPSIALVGHGHFCALGQAVPHRVICWGDNTPTPVAGLSNLFPKPLDLEGSVDELAIASATTCVRIGGAVSCFGEAALGGTGALTGTQGQKPVGDIGDAISLVGNGALFCARRPAPAWGVRATCWGVGLPTPTDVPGETAVAQVAITGAGEVLVRRTDGSLASFRAPSLAVPGAPFGAVVELPLPAVDLVAADRSVCVVRASDQRISCARVDDGVAPAAAKFVEVGGFSADDPPIEMATGASYSTYPLDTSCARTAAGKVLCWGADRWGQVGAGTTGWELTPKIVPGITNAARIALGELGAAVVAEDGSASTWGSVRGLGHTLADGTTPPVPVPLPGPPPPIADLQIGLDDERIYGVPKGGTGLYLAQLGQAQAGARLQAFPGASSFLPGVVALRGIDVGVAGVGSDTSLAYFVDDPNDARFGNAGLLPNGGGPAGAAYVSIPLPNLVGYARGIYHALAWDAAGALHCWGGGGATLCGQPQTPDGKVLSPVVVPLAGEQIVGACGGSDHTCAVTKSGVVYCWGSFANGVGGKGGPGAPPDGEEAEKKQIPATESIKGVACGNFNACAWSDEKVYCWGQNTFAQLGLGHRLNRITPTVVPGLAGAKHLALAREYGCAVTMDGHVACWGTPMGGRLGNGALGYAPDFARAVLLP